MMLLQPRKDLSDDTMIPTQLSSGNDIMHRSDRSMDPSDATGAWLTSLRLTSANYNMHHSRSSNEMSLTNLLSYNFMHSGIQMEEESSFRSSHLGSNRMDGIMSEYQRSGMNFDRDHHPSFHTDECFTRTEQRQGGRVSRTFVLDMIDEALALTSHHEIQIDPVGSWAALPFRHANNVQQQQGGCPYDPIMPQKQ
jgi:hypothetical protein